MKSEFYMVCRRVVTMDSSIWVSCKLGVIYSYMVENNGIGIICSSSLYISKTKYNNRPLISFENESWK
jgi:hypothetical protein